MTIKQPTSHPAEDAVRDAMQNGLVQGLSAQECQRIQLYEMVERSCPRCLVQGAHTH
jgi:hypothetical protein